MLGNKSIKHQVWTIILFETELSYTSLFWKSSFHLQKLLSSPCHAHATLVKPMHRVFSEYKSGLANKVRISNITAKQTGYQIRCSVPASKVMEQWGTIDHNRTYLLNFTVLPVLSGLMGTLALPVKAMCPCPCPSDTAIVSELTIDKAVVSWWIKNLHAGLKHTQFPLPWTLISANPVMLYSDAAGLLHLEIL